MATCFLLRICPVVLLVSTSLFAQIGKSATAQPTRTELEQQLDRQAAEMRQKVAEGTAFRSHVRVTARLKNGNTIRGIVKDGLLVERFDGLRFVASEKGEPGAGLRIYYWNGSSSYVFLPFADMKECKINERITAEQLRAIELQTKAREEAAQQDKKVQDPAVDAVQQQPPAADGETTAKADEPKASTTGKEPGTGLSKEQQDLFQLVQDYPPTAGWSQQRRDEISRRMAVIGSKPSPNELRFVAKFADWQRACELFRLKPAEPATPAGETENSRRSRRNR